MTFSLYGYIRPAFHPLAYWQEWTAAASGLEELARLAEPFGDYPGNPRSDQLTGYDMISLALSSVAAGASRSVVVPGAGEYDPGGLGTAFRAELSRLGWRETPAR